MSQVTMRVIFALFIVIDVLVAVRSNLTVSTVLPNLHLCHRHMQDVSQCVQRSIESMKPYLAAGVKVLNIPSFEPFHFSEFTFQAEKEFNGTGILKNLTIHGITNYTINNTRVNHDENDIKFHARFPLIRLSFTYDVDARILMFFGHYIYVTLNGHDVNVEFTELTADITINGEYSSGLHDNEQYFRVTVVETELNIGRTNITAFNENGEKIADEIMKNAVSISLEILAMSAWNAINSEIANYIQIVANNIFFNFPVKISFRG